MVIFFCWPRGKTERITHDHTVHTRTRRRHVVLVHSQFQPKDWKACRSECQKRSDCAHWTFVRRRDPDRAARRKKCVLRSSKSGGELLINFASYDRMTTLWQNTTIIFSHLGQAENEFRISGPRDCNSSGSGGGGSGSPPDPVGNGEW